MRLAVASTIVWWSYDLGLWGDARATEQLWSNAKCTIFRNPAARLASLENEHSMSKLELMSSSKVMKTTN